ncbi:NB-ARC domain, LRR domain containing protein [Trema orientale]|uniref:NB-ARC domain, LRR domain containing protein n=1 Tax=Trema orientale TaxID=63057 RepID=A0A2P5FAF5_TREOI|nr:NB-ARC domain, LRR domain containing protein [Trema orientale]
MAEIAVKFLLDKLAPLFENDLQLLRGVREEVIYLRGELERTRAFLKVADALEDNDEELKVWVKQVRDIAHDTEDALDEFTLLQAHHHHGEGLYGSIHRFSCCIKNTKARYRIASELQAINLRIRKVCEAHKRLRRKVNNAADQNSGKTWGCHSGEALLLERTDIVGIDEPKRQLVEWLVKGGSGREVVSVAAMGGMGKTTLAKQVCNTAEVKKHFKISAWITVSQSFRLGELLKDLVRQLFGEMRRPVPDGVDSMNNYQLKKLIKELLQKRRYLIVLDDVWHLYEWDALKYALPNNNSGSRVLLTTRNSEVASTTSLESDGKVYNLEPLPLLESWKLLSRKTFQGNSCPAHLEEICENILRKCEGLPLAIVAISGVLATKDKRRIDEWDMVGRSLGAEIDGNDKLKDLKKVLSLSFNDLPYYLKSCFLYLSIFPEDELIEHMRLIRLWIAEGFIEAKEGKTLEDVAEDYLTELLNRSMLQAAATRCDGRVKNFRIHDLLREIIISKSRDPNFAMVVKEHTLPWPDKIRRLSIHNTLQNVEKDRSVSQLRSLFMFGVVEMPSINALFPRGFRLLNVLDMRNVPLCKFPVEVVSLYFLKYLSLRNSKVKVIPSLIVKLQNLETLDLKHCYVSELPVEIIKLQKLRHLLLCFIEVNQDNIIELGKLQLLRRLGIIKLRKEDGKALCSSLESLTKLCALSITSVEEDEIVDLHHFSSPPLLLQRLYLSGRLESLPHWIPSLHSLVILCLKWSKLCDDPIIVLQDLPNLAHLELCQVFEGDALCFKAGGFKKLKHLGLDEFKELRYVNVEMGAMPCVEKLSIQRCHLLEKVPSGIEYLSNLQVLEFFDMPEKFLRNAQNVEYWKVAHIPEVYSTYKREGWDVYVGIYAEACSRIYNLRLGIIKLRKKDGRALCSSLESLTKLCALSITSVEEDEIVDLHHLSSPPLLLQRLDLRRRLESLPHWIPSLHSLVFEGDALGFRAGGFKKLKHLGLDEYKELSLKVLEFFDMPEKFLRNAQSVEYWKVAHIPEVYSTHWGEGGWDVYSLDSLSEGEGSSCPSSIIKSHELGNRWK